MLEFDWRDFLMPSSKAWLSRLFIRLTLFSLFLSRLWNFLSRLLSPNSSPDPECLYRRLFPSLFDSASFFLVLWTLLSMLLSNLSSVMASARFVKLWTRSFTLSLSVGFSFWRSFWTNFFTVDFSVSSKAWLTLVTFGGFSIRMGWDWLDWLNFFLLSPEVTNVSKWPAIQTWYFPIISVTFWEVYLSPPRYFSWGRCSPPGWWRGCRGCPSAAPRGWRRSDPVPPRMISRAWLCPPGRCSGRRVSSSETDI